MRTRQTNKDAVEMITQVDLITYAVLNEKIKALEAEKSDLRDKFIRLNASEAETEKGDYFLEVKDVTKINLTWGTLEDELGAEEVKHLREVLPKTTTPYVYVKPIKSGG